MKWRMANLEPKKKYHRLLNFVQIYGLSNLKSIHFSKGMFKFDHSVNNLPFFLKNKFSGHYASSHIHVGHLTIMPIQMVPIEIITYKRFIF